MIRIRARAARMAALSLVVLAPLGCGGGAAPTSSSTSSASSASSSGSESRPAPTPAPAAEAEAPSAYRSGRNEASLANLRPAGTESALAGVTRDALDPEAYQRGALAYVDTEVPAMTLLWGQVYRIVDTHGRKTVDVANAMARVIREHLETDATGAATAHLAPGEMPFVRGPDGREYAPLAYLYEHSMSRTRGLVTPRDQYEGAAAVFAEQLRVLCRSGRPVLDDPTYAWLCGVAQAGHTDAYAHWVIGPAFGPQFEAWQAANETKLQEFLRHFQRRPFRPVRGLRPDDLFVVRRGD